jgi:hypothetical protein
VALADGSLRRHEALLTRMAALVEPERQRTRSAAADPGAPRRPGRPVLHARRGGAEAPKRRNAEAPCFPQDAWRDIPAIIESLRQS